jgi:hypothetical protein
MIDAALARLDVDPVQWRALVRSLLRIEYPARHRGAGARQADRAGRALAGTLFAYGLYGATPAVVFGVGASVEMGGSIAILITMFAVGMSLLVGDAADLIEPRDLQILGHRPVSSRTYLAVRVSTLIFRSMLISAMTLVAPAIVLVFKYEMHGLAIVAGLLAGSQIAGAAMTLLVVVSFGILLRRAGTERLQRYVAYASSIAAFAMWMSVLVITRGSVGKVIGGFTMVSPLWYLLPPTWFASFAILAAGEWSALALTGVILSVATVIAGGWFIRDKLSMTYSTDVARVSAVSSAKGSVATLKWIRGLTDETRAVAILVRSQLEHDTKFRMAFISLLPVTIVYMLMGGPPADPFVPHAGDVNGANIGLIQVAVLFLPMTLRQVIVNSESHKAAWIFNVTPARRDELVLSSRNLVAICFLFPYLALLAALFSAAFGDTSHALLHAFFLGLFALTLFQVGLAMLPQLPFSRPLATNDRFGSQLMIMLVTVGVGMIGFMLVSAFAYRHPPRLIAVTIVMIAIGWLMTAITRWRVRRMKVEELYFD